MKQSIDLRQSQKLAMTPQLQQAIKLLQMSAIELNEELQHAHESNPLLEILDDTAQEAEQERNALEPEDLTKARDPGPSNQAGDEQLYFEQISNPDLSSWDDPQNYAPIDQRRASPNSVQNFNDLSSQYTIPEQGTTLRETLGNQAIFLFEDADDRRIAHHLIQNINDAGYIDVPLEDIELTLSQDGRICLHDIERVLVVLQTLEPVGVAARNPQECLLLQLAAKNKNMAGYRVAFDIIRNHLPLLADKEYSKLRKVTRTSEKELGRAVEIIRQLNPHPGYSVGDATIDYIVPDILVDKKGKHWYANLNPKAIPKLSINRDYQNLINQNSNDQCVALKEQLQHARWLVNSIEKRHQTILSVAKEIVERQQDFFQFGAKKMRPLTLNDIAEPLGMHELTVSRATTEKYLSTPQGNFELKYFFSSQVTSSNGDAISSTAIQSEIKLIVENELPTKPVSDAKICGLLADNGYNVARRTVAKYREQLNIPSSSKRKSL